jgi:hypothetical protein
VLCAYRWIDPGSEWRSHREWYRQRAFKNLKGDLCIRPIFHQLQRRIEAHIFVCFLAYCVQVTLRHQLRAKAPGLTPRQVLEKFGRMQMMDVHFPTTDGRELVSDLLTSWKLTEPRFRFF